MIIAEELTKRFDNFLAVDRISLEVQPGQVLALLGQNGAGKTTTVRMLTSILTPSAGKASVCGYDVVYQADKVRASVGVLTEQHGLYGRMNAEEYLLFFASLYGLKPGDVAPRISEYLERFGLSHSKKKRLGEFSKGMRQKLALIRAVIHDPPVLLLDEPTSAMDPESARLVRDSIQSLRTAGRTIFLCTHNLSEAEELADIVAIIRNGRIILSGDIEDVKHRLLGPEEYEARLASGSNSSVLDLPEGVELCEHNETRLRFRIAQPETTIPVLLKSLLDAQFPVISFDKVPRSLEQAFLQAVISAEEEDYVR